MRIIETDNDGRDFPSEKFVDLPRMSEAHAKAVVKAINDGFEPHCQRYWKVVENDYVLQTGFEP